ncbi:ribonuclease p/mrp subunit [Neofusicoccum parvum]|nr:ribonuclease p/mrp subunit [Neofusicoccum parvum]
MVTEGPILLWEGTEPVAEWVSISLAGTYWKLTVHASVWLVHGLRGDAIKTWSKGDVCWPRDLLPQEISNIRVFSWGYDSDVANWSGSVSQASIFGHGENLLRDIASKRVADHEKRALIFVGHSLGGLVIKQALIRSSQYFHNKENERLGIIYQQTEALMVANIAKISLRKPNNKLIRTISRESDVLEQQRQAFASISNNMRIACFYEEMPTSFRRFMKVDLGVIVPEYSASIDGFSIERIGVRADHFAMCKFSTSSELGFQRIIDRLREYVHLVEENIAAALVQRQLEETALAEEKERGMLNA